MTAREIERFNDRSYGFSEQVGHWDLPMHEGGVALDVAVGPGEDFSFTLYCNSMKACLSHDSTYFLFIFSLSSASPLSTL